mmetsp:Transcript_213/g.832  ORF Transcript_213/g.832 Transcript_213/m.832 type:complete len:254 (-) Transcript_213:122-883(-)
MRTGSPSSDLRGSVVVAASHRASAARSCSKKASSWFATRCSQKLRNSGAVPRAATAASWIAARCLISGPQVFGFPYNASHMHTHRRRPLAPPSEAFPAAKPATAGGSVFAIQSNPAAATRPAVAARRERVPVFSRSVRRMRASSRGRSVTSTFAPPRARATPMTPTPAPSSSTSQPVRAEGVEEAPAEDKRAAMASQLTPLAFHMTAPSSSSASHRSSVPSSGTPAPRSFPAGAPSPSSVGSPAAAPPSSLPS